MSTSLLGFRGCWGFRRLHIVKTAQTVQTKGSSSHSGLFHDWSSCNKWFGGRGSCCHPCCPGFGFGIANQQGVDPCAAAWQRCRSARSPGAWDCKQHVPMARWPGLGCFKQAVACPSNVMPKFPGAGFSTDGKQSGCSWLESGHARRCGEVWIVQWVDSIHHLNTSMQCKSLMFETAVVDALQDDTSSANQLCRSPFGASTRLEAGGHV